MSSDEVHLPLACTRPRRAGRAIGAADGQSVDGEEAERDDLPQASHNVNVGAGPSQNRAPISKEGARLPLLPLPQHHLHSCAASLVQQTANGTR